MKKIFLAFAAFLAACAAPYKPVLDNKDTARIRFVSQFTSPAIAAVLKNGCVPKSQLSWDAHAETIGTVTLFTPDRWHPAATESLGMPSPPTRTPWMVYIERNIPARQVISLGFYTSWPGIASMYATCSSGLKFVPESGADYEITFEGISGGCNVTLRRLVPKDGETSRALVPGATGAPPC